MATISLKRRLKALEAPTGDGDDEGCPRCVGTMTIVTDAVSGRFNSASWNGEPLDEQEVRERSSERECPNCGRRIDPDETVEIVVGGRDGA